MEDIFLERLFITAQFTKRKVEITHFKQQETDFLYDSWERFKLLLRKFLNHNMSNMEQIQNFVKGLQTQVRMLLDASARGTIRTLTEPQVKELIVKMSLNEFNFSNTRGFNRVETKNRSHSDLNL